MVILSSFQLKTWRSSPWSTISDDPLSDDTEAEGETGTSIWHAVIVPQAPGPFGRKLGPSHQWVALHSRTWWLNPLLPTGLNPCCTKYKILIPATCLLSSDWCLLVISKALFQYLIRHLIISSIEVSKPRDLCLELSNHPEIWQAPSSNVAEAPVKYQSFVIIWTTNFAALKLDEILW